MRRPLFFVVFCLVGGVIGAASLSPQLQPGPLDKFYHTSAYALWAFAAVHVARRSWSRVIALGLIIALGGAIEVLQSMFHRQMSVADFLANCTGVAIGGFAGIRFVAWKVTRERLLSLWPLALLATLVVPIIVLIPYFTARPLSNWDCNLPLTLASEADGSNPWRGKLECLKITAGSEVLKADLGSSNPQCDLPDLEGATESLSLTQGRGSFLNQDTRDLCHAIKAADVVLVDAWFLPDPTKRRRPARVFSWSGAGNDANLSIDQVGIGYFPRWRGRATGSSGMLSGMRLRDFPVAWGQPQRITLEYRDEQMRTYLDGERQGVIADLDYGLVAIVGKMARVGLLIGGVAVLIIALAGMMEGRRKPKHP